MSDLCTLRAGEPVHDQVVDAAVLLDTECVKIRPVSGGTACIFYEVKASVCRLYGHRPLECRTLKCWDTNELAEAARQPRLTRMKVVGVNSALAELIREHDTRCGCARMLEWLDQNTAHARMALEEARSYDQALRAVLVERAGLDPMELEFLLGRHLEVVVQGLVRWRNLCL